MVTSLGVRKRSAASNSYLAAAIQALEASEAGAEAAANCAAVAAASEGNVVLHGHGLDRARLFVARPRLRDHGGSRLPGHLLLEARHGGCWRM
jgi:hypothetical protein